MNVTKNGDGKDLKENQKEIVLLIQSELDTFIEKNTKEVRLIDVIEALDISFIARDVPHKHSSFSKSSLMKVYILKKLKNIRKHSLLQLLLSDDLIILGLRRFPSKGCLNQFIKKIDRCILTVLVDIIRNFCIDKNVVDLPFFDAHLQKRREVARYEDKLEEAIRMTKRLVKPYFKIPLRHNSSMTNDDFLDILIFIASRHDFCYGGTNMYRYLHKDKRIPKGDTILHHLSKLSREEIEQLFEKVFDVIFRFAKKEYAILRRQFIDIAIDIHEIPYYGDKNDTFVCGGKFENGTAYYYKFITCSIVIAGRRFVLDARPLTQLDDQTEILDKMLTRIKQKIHINRLYADRGFDKPKVYNLLKKHHLKFVIPKIKSPTVKEWMDKAEGSDAYVVKNFKIGKGNDSATINLVLVNDEDGIKRAFATNLDIAPTIAHYLFVLYKKRWGIETAYRQMDNDFKPRTTSKNFNLRILYFFFTVILYNLWILINICVSIKLYGKIRTQPVIRAKFFMEVLLAVKTGIG